MTLCGVSYITNTHVRLFKGYGSRHDGTLCFHFTLLLKAETIYSATHINITGVFTASGGLFTTSR